MKTKNVIFALLIAVGGGASALGLNHVLGEKQEVIIKETIIEKPSPTYSLATGLQGLKNAPDFTEAAGKTIDAVVHVKTKMQRNGNRSSLFGGYGDGMVTATGSGVIISDDGYIITNNHVIDKSRSIEVVLNDKRSYDAKLIGTDPSTDLALLKIEGKDFVKMEIGDSEALNVGEWVLAIGNPFSLTSTVTAGIVSAKARNINLLKQNYAIESFIQTDAAVNPGNSGGALVNTNGELIGINTAIASKTGSYTGYSFAVPVTIVEKVIKDLQEFGTVQRALLGISIKNIDSNLAEELGIEKIEGVYVAVANEGSSAEEAGIENEDIITEINQIAVNKVSELQEQVSKYRPGDEIEVTVKRGSKIKKYMVVLKNSLGTTSSINKEAIAILGASFQDVTDKEKAKLKIKFGVKVDELGAGKLLKAGVQKDFIIMFMNNRPVKTFEDLQTILNHTRGGVYIEGIYPDGTTGYYAFGLR